MKSYLNARSILNICIALCCTLILCSCSFLSPVKSQPESEYVISASPTVISSKHRAHGTLLVMPLESNPAYNTTQIAYSIKPYQLAYFSYNRWAETPAQMLQPLIIQTLQKTHYYHAVVTPPFTSRYDYVLNTQLLKLQEDFTHSPTVVQLVLRAQLMKMSSGQVVATKDIQVDMPVHYGTPYSGVVAANRATAVALAQLAEFCMRNSH